MGGVHGWWDEDAQPVDGAGDKSPFHEIDEQVLARLQESGAVQHLEELSKVEPEPATKEKVEQLQAKVSSQTGVQTLVGISPMTLYGTSNTVSGNTTTWAMDYVNLTGQDFKRLNAQADTLKKVNGAIEDLTVQLLSLPMKEYDTIKAQLEVVARIMGVAKDQGLL